MKLISSAKAAKLLGVDPATLRRHESPDGKWTSIYGFRVRVFRLDIGPHAQRRYNEEEIFRLLDRLEREAADH